MRLSQTIQAITWDKNACVDACDMDDLWENETVGKIHSFIQKMKFDYRLITVPIALRLVF